MIYTDNCIRICMDSKEREQFKGFLCGVAVEEPVAFCNWMDFMVKVDQVYDAIGKPQPSHVIRSFDNTAPAYKPYVAKPVRYHESEAIARLHGQAATCDLLLQSRHHAEWQGLLKQEDGTLLGRFSTAEECLDLLLK